MTSRDDDVEKAQLDHWNAEVAKWEAQAKILAIGACSPGPTNAQRTRLPSGNDSPKSCAGPSGWRDTSCSCTLGWPP